MRYLESSLALRIMDILGIFTKDMPDIRSDLLKIDKQEMWAIKMPIDGESFINTIYSELGDKRYMICGTEKNKLWFCIIIGDQEEKNPELNRIFIMVPTKEEVDIREADTIEISNIFATFECFRHFFKGWEKYEAKDADIKLMKKFMASIAEEDAEE